MGGDLQLVLGGGPQVADAVDAFGGFDVVGGHDPGGVAARPELHHEVEDAAAAVAPRVQPDRDHGGVHREHLRLFGFHRY